ncbi:hypothetical protein GH733_007955, partial [Mirounga leonina]
MHGSRHCDLIYTSDQNLIGCAETARNNLQDKVKDQEGLGVLKWMDYQLPEDNSILWNY